MNSVQAFYVPIIQFMIPTDDIIDELQWRPLANNDERLLTNYCTGAHPPIAGNDEIITGLIKASWARKKEGGEKVTCVDEEAYIK